MASRRRKEANQARDMVSLLRRKERQLLVDLSSASQIASHRDKRQAELVSQMKIDVLFLSLPVLKCFKNREVMVNCYISYSEVTRRIKLFCF